MPLVRQIPGCEIRSTKSFSIISSFFMNGTTLDSVIHVMLSTEAND